VKKHSVTLNGHRTSVSLEEEFWRALKEIAAARGMSVNRLIAEIDRDRGAGNLSSAIRRHILQSLRHPGAKPGNKP